MFFIIVVLGLLVSLSEVISVAPSFKSKKTFQHIVDEGVESKHSLLFQDIRTCHKLFECGQDESSTISPNDDIEVALDEKNFARISFVTTGPNNELSLHKRVLNLQGTYDDSKSGNWKREWNTCDEAKVKLMMNKKENQECALQKEDKRHSKNPTRRLMRQHYQRKLDRCAESPYDEGALFKCLNGGSFTHAERGIIIDFINTYLEMKDCPGLEIVAQCCDGDTNIAEYDGNTYGWISKFYTGYYPEPEKQESINKNNFGFCECPVTGPKNHTSPAAKNFPKTKVALTSDFVGLPVITIKLHHICIGESKMQRMTIVAFVEYDENGKISSIDQKSPFHDGNACGEASDYSSGSEFLQTDSCTTKCCDRR